MGNSNCSFCEIIKEDKVLIYQDELIGIFEDLKPRAEKHLLAIPKKHIKNVNFLEKEDVPMLIHMKKKVFELFNSKYSNTDQLM